MDKNKLVLTLFALVLMAGGIGYAVSQLWVEKSLMASVTVEATAGLTLQDTEGNEITTLNYGVIPLNEWVGLTVVVTNSGNAPLSLTCARTDTNTGISTNFANVDGSWFAPSTPKPLAPSDSISVVIEVYAGGGALGDYSLSFLFTGTG